MNFEFVVLGICFIWAIFYLNKKNPSNMALIAGEVFLLIGYFVQGITIKSITINVFMFFGLVYLIIFGIVDKNTNYKNALSGGVLIAIVYGLLSLIKLDYNMFFSVLPVAIIICVVNFLNMFNLKECVVSTISGLVLSEIFNIFFMLPKLEYMSLFGDNLALCIVVCIGVKYLLNLLGNIVLRVKHEKVS